MIDLHSHLLPGIDDGPPDMAGSVALARTAAEQGTRVLAATPHLRGDFPDVRADELAARCDEVRSALREEGVELEVVQGGEAGLMWAVHASDEDLRAGSYGARGTDLLVESPYGALTSTFEQLLHSLVERGYRVILAHPENNPTFVSDPARLSALVARGALLQVTARSLMRPRRRKGPRAFAEALLREGQAHVLASDAHSGATLRPPALGAGVEAAAELVGEPRARWMVEDAPAAILAGDPLPEPPPIRPSGGGLLSRLRASSRAPSRSRGG